MTLPALEHTIKELCDDRMPANLTLSPQTGCAAFLLRRADIAADRYKTELYFQSGPSAPVLLEENTWFDLHWTQEGTLLACRNAAGKTEIVSFSEDGARTVVSTMPGMYKPVILRENGSGLFTRRVPTHQKNADNAALISAEYPIYHNDVGLTADMRNALFSYDADSGLIRRMTKEYFSIRLCAVNEELGVAAVVGEQYANTPGICDEIRLISMADGSERLLLPGGRWCVQNIAFWQGDIIFVGTDSAGTAPNCSKLVRLAVSDGSLTILSDEDLCYGSTIVCDVRFGGGQNFVAYGDRLYAVFTRDERSVLMQFSCQEGWQMLCDQLQSVDMFAVNAHRVVCTGLSNGQRPELYELSSGNIQQRSRFHPLFSGPETEPFSVMVGGREIRGFVLPPAHMEAGRKYPAILDIHGGPRMAFGPVAGHDQRMLSQAGCFVLCCNPTGSDGRGSTFYELDAEWGKEVLELLAFMRSAVDKYPIDPGRIGLLGGSYGGYLVNCLISSGEPFAAAVCERGISFLPWQELLGDLPEAYRIKQFRRFGPPTPDTYRGVSPLCNAMEVTTPTLFIQADADYRCPLIHGAAMFHCMQKKGIPSRTIVFHKENHGVNRTGSPKKRIKRWYEILRWFEQYLVEVHQRQLPLTAAEQSTS